MTRPDGAAPVTALARGLALGLVDGGMAPVGVVGVGVDAVDLVRFARVLGRRGSVADRLFTYPFHDVEVVRAGLDAPGLVLTGAAESLAHRTGVVRWHLSLSHTDQVAVALVVAEGARPGTVSPDRPATS